ncbi:MAG: rubrerythrin family protein, partial [Lentisphaerae bacterium]|nr:rubrerythrin family protein [Lentisphaerota bacterium]
MQITERDKQTLLVYQRNEMTEALIYRRLVTIQDNPENKRILEKIADDERRHYEQWKALTGIDTKPDMVRVQTYYWISKILGLTFGIKLMEHGEANAQQLYEAISTTVPQAKE